MVNTCVLYSNLYMQTKIFYIYMRILSRRFAGLTSPQKQKPRSNGAGLTKTESAVTIKNKGCCQQTVGSHAHKVSYKSNRTIEPGRLFLFAQKSDDSDDQQTKSPSYVTIRITSSPVRIGGLTACRLRQRRVCPNIFCRNENPALVKR